jgi:putative tricarboxylic transport membrane protein
MRRDWITGLLLMGVAFGYYYMADALPRSLLSDEVGADGFPKLLAISLFLLSVIMVVMGVFTRPSVTAAEAQEKAVTERHAALKAAGMFLLGVGYLAVVTWVGYPVAVGLLIAGVLLFQRETLSLKLVIIACFGGIFFWFFFVIVLKIPLPSGIWSDLFSGGL